MKDLHWLPVKQRIEYKLMLITYQCLNGNGPVYLRELIDWYHPRRHLRSADAFLLESKFVRSGQKHRDRSFTYAVPFLWNNLPIFIRSSSTTDAFKTRLKTHLFKLAYDL